jgi:hypothetical protein
MAASLALGLFVGMLVLREPAVPFASVDGTLVARGELDTALDSQLASAAAETPVVRIGLSFRNRDGDFCRTFQLQRDGLAGLACRSSGAWQLQALVAAPAPEGEVRSAAAMPIAVLRAVDAAIEGEPLDAEAEAAARDADWRNPRNMAE